MDEVDIPVAGGALRAVSWPGDGPLVIAAHGITANALSWAAVARALGGKVHLVAPDLRGRGFSAQLPGPYGMDTHADDLVAIADYFGISRVPLVGHSMGGFVVAATAGKHPERVGPVLLVDGGIALGVPAAIDVDVALEAVIGPAMRRLSMNFDSEDSYVAYFRANPALGRYWSADLEAYILRDFTGTGSTCNLAAVRGDAADMLRNPRPAPFPLLWAPRGLADEDTGLYRADQLTGVDAEPVPDVNHYTILTAGAGHVASRLLALL
ncbi:alpha/beta hydrolase fold protein [Actinoplanes sp. SE50]|uniref:alpha/beta fold hydrolase n=1 Tax=unclassified Actinoplanes TaxID=2626549 RepID=UPI00023EC5DE|nr:MULTISPECIES: alpha/beta hydrolase [unclassified Actinoplanes]AEV83640.1 alpha/beta hydrolase fold protein [Actinoplanes sp. SE50/110]ATO82216.1 alpha/beta hydrolase fold protein [Actinoplanes sp. SE50]SLL99623.1 alpha/beta hydrolase fold protein [Actinoplanes sp. SE50/110]